MTDQALAEKFRALGDATRMRIFRSLMEHSGSGYGSGTRSASGPNASEVCSYVTGSPKINSTVSHHLKELRQAGLIEVKREKQCMIFRPRPEGVREMLSFLLDVE